MERFELSFEAKPKLGTDALICLLWRRGGIVGPIAVVLFPILLFTMGLDPRNQTFAAIMGGAAAMLFLILLLVIQMRRRAARHAFERVGSRTIRIAFDTRGVHISSGLGESTIVWSGIDRLWSCKRVVLIFFQRWQYLAVPAEVMPDDVVAFIRTQINHSK